MNITKNTFDFEEIEDSFFEPHGKSDNVVITISDFDAHTLSNFRESISTINKVNQPAIPICINSFGGDAYNLLAMMNILEVQDRPIITICEGYAMSAGLYLFSCGSPGMRFASASSILMFHSLQTAAMGNLEEIGNSAEQGKKLQEILLEKLNKNTGQRKDYWNKVIATQKGQNLYMTGKEALDHKLVTNVGLSPSIQFVTERKVVY